jgi:flagellin
MAMNDISLTAGMRSNLLSLQNTVDLLDRTQGRLATGKKVNSALDNPVSFFASQNLLNRASEIDSLKDAMGQAVQTINAADKGISAITSMIEQAKGIAQSALSANDETTASDRDTVLGTITTNFTDGATVKLGGVTLTATDTGADNTFEVGTAAADTATNLAAAIEGVDWGTEDYEFRAEVDDAGVLTISKYENNGGAGVEDPVDATLDDIVFTASDAGAGEFTKDLDEGATELSNLQDQYNALRTQLDALAEDSGYKGKNLLSATAASQSMTVQFEGTTLTVEGFDATTGTDGLDISAATWTQSGSIEDDLTKLDSAMDKLSSESAKLSSNLSIITVRQDFTDNMINVLTQGSDNLTLADTNEEGANMLMLQTRQSLSSTALSLSAQAAQSVLRLFG